MIKLVNINKSFSEKIILNNFNYQFNKLKMYGIKGGSGSGKSTLLNIIGLIDSDYKGEIFIDNEKINISDTRKINQILKEKIYYVFQNYALIDDKSVADNFKIITNINKKYLGKEEDAVKKVGLPKNILTHPIYSLSGGEQQRISIARVFLRDSTIILADEPTGNLDYENSIKIINLLKSLAEQGKTVIIATHDNFVLQQCDEIIDLEKSKGDVYL